MKTDWTEQATVALISHTEVGGSEWVAAGGAAGNNHNIPYTTLLQGAGPVLNITIQLTPAIRFLDVANKYSTLPYANKCIAIK